MRIVVSLAAVTVRDDEEEDEEEEEEPPPRVRNPRKDKIAQQVAAFSTKTAVKER